MKIPKFELTQLVNMKQLLMNLGMVDLFKAEADLSGMNGIGGLMVSEVVHKAFVNVNEEGAEAAAATAVIVVESASLDPITFIANKPFLFFIWEQDSGSILFMGRFAAPPTGEARAVGVFGETQDRSSAAEWHNMATLLVTSLCLAVCAIMH